MIKKNNNNNNNVNEKLFLIDFFPSYNLTLISAIIRIFFRL